jgi:hypothetical protein
MLVNHERDWMPPQSLYLGGAGAWTVSSGHQGKQGKETTVGGDASTQLASGPVIKIFLAEDPAPTRYRV